MSNSYVPPTGDLYVSTTSAPKISIAFSIPTFLTISRRMSAFGCLRIKSFVISEGFNSARFVYDESTEHVENIHPHISEPLHRLCAIGFGNYDELQLASLWKSQRQNKTMSIQLLSQESSGGEVFHIPVIGKLLAEIVSRNQASSNHEVPRNKDHSILLEEKWPALGPTLGPALGPPLGPPLGPALGPPLGPGTCPHLVPHLGHH